MSLPTLLLKGNLRDINDNKENQAKLDKYIPVEYIMEWLQERLNLSGPKNKILVLKSETASGKSTTLPPWIYKTFMRTYSNSGGAIGNAGMAITQPRVLTAINNVKVIVKYNDTLLKVGKNIGWSTKFNKLHPQETAIISMTVGTLTQQLKVLTDDEIISKYRFILLDEVHERDLNLDLAISMLKGLVYRNKDKPECPFIILMSATFAHEPLLRYFGVGDDNFIWVTGRTAPIEEMWDWNDGKSVDNYTTAAVQVVKRICDSGIDDNPASNDIIIFLPGSKEIKLVANKLMELNSKLDQKLSVLKLDSATVSSGGPEYKLITEIPVYKHKVYINNSNDGNTYIPFRRCILSTNVAETGVTLENLRYVIDAGFNRETEYNPIYGTNMLITKPAPQSRIRQRRGRAGRKLPGVFYPLYTREVYDQLQVEQYPQILTNNISEYMLTIINEQLRVKTMNNISISKDNNLSFDISTLDMLDLPTPDALHQNLELLYTIGFITNNAQPWNVDMEQMVRAQPASSFGLSRLGAMAVQFNGTPPESIRMIQAAYFWKCSILDTITIATWLKYRRKDFFYLPRKFIGKDSSQQPHNCNWFAVFKDSISRRIYSEHVLFRARLTIADDFIFGIFMFSAIKYQIANHTPRDAIEKLMHWCEYNYISYPMCIKFLRDRDELIEQMITMGVEIFRNEEYSYANVEPEDFMELMTKLKYCIYDGYRNNVLTRVESAHGDRYYTKQGLMVKVPSMFAEDEVNKFERERYKFAYESLPQHMLYSGLTIDQVKDSPTGECEIKVDKISALDGFISYDNNFAI